MIHISDVGKVPEAVLKAMENQARGGPSIMAEGFPVSIPQCRYTEWSSDLGETVKCGLPEHGPKVKHGAWVKA